MYWRSSGDVLDEEPEVADDGVVSQEAVAGLNEVVYAESVSGMPATKAHPHAGSIAQAAHADSTVTSTTA